MINKIKLYSTIFFAILLIGSFLEIKILKNRERQLKYEKEQIKLKMQSLEMELYDNKKALAKREQDSATLINETIQLKKELGEIYKNDSQANNWSNTNIPVAIFERLHEQK